MTADDYLQTLLHLMPPGKAYPRTVQGDLPATLKALADELARVDMRTDNLFDEADPRMTLEMLVDWERTLNLSLQDSIGARQRAVTSKLTELGGQSQGYFIALAASLGYEIAITEYRPYTCIDPVDKGIYGETSRFVWQVNAQETTVNEATCQSSCGESLRSWGNELLETEMSRRKPAHTTVIFAYGG